MSVKLSCAYNPFPKRMTDAEFIEVMDQIEILTDSYNNEFSPSQEGVGMDIAWDGLIGWLLHKNDHTLINLRAAVPECIQRIKDAPDDNFGEWKFLHQINIFSKYLPDYSQMDGAANALKRAAAYIRTIREPKKFDLEKFKTCFKNSCYMKKGKYSDDEGTGTGFWDLWTEDIRVRGWTQRECFLKALNAMKGLLTDMDNLEKFLKSFAKKTYPKEDKENAKAMVKSAKQVIHLIGYLGRGVTSASRKISGGALKRIFTTED